MATFVACDPLRTGCIGATLDGYLSSECKRILWLLRLFFRLTKQSQASKSSLVSCIQGFGCSSSVAKVIFSIFWLAFLNYATEITQLKSQTDIR